MHFVSQLLLQANIEKTIEEASMERIWSALETAPALYQESPSSSRREGCPTPNSLFSFLLFSLLSIVRIVGTLFKWKELSSWALFSNMDKCLDIYISYPLCKTSVSTLDDNKLIWDERLSPRRNKHSGLCVWFFKAPKNQILAHQPTAREPRAPSSLVCLHVCPRLALHHICVGIPSLANAPCMILIEFKYFWTPEHLSLFKNYTTLFSTYSCSLHYKQILKVVIPREMKSVCSCLLLPIIEMNPIGYRWMSFQEVRGCEQCPKRLFTESGSSVLPAPLARPSTTGPAEALWPFSGSPSGHGCPGQEGDAATQ